MTAIFLFIYRFFEKQRLLFWLVLAAFLSISVYFGSKNVFEEDISKILPKNKNSEKISFIFNNTKFSDRMVFSVSSTDGSRESLVDFADSLTDIFRKELQPKYIREIRYKFSQEAMLSLYDYIFRNLPVFLENKDYLEIQKMLSTDAVENKIKGNFNILMSPAGFAMKKFILTDPISLTALVTKKLQNLNLNENYTVKDERIFGKDGKSLVFFVTPLNPASETANNSIMLQKMDLIINNMTVKSGNKIIVDYFGSTPVAVGNAKQLKNDIYLTVTLAVLGIFLFVIWFYRSIKIAFLSFLPAIFGGSFALAVIYLFQGRISAISLGVGSLILGIIVDYAFYIFNSYKLKKDLIKVIQDMTFTLLICSLTTATAFFSLLFVKSQVLHDLGIFAGISIIGAALFSLIALPHFLGNKKGLLESQKETPRILKKLIEYPLEKSIAFIFVIALLCGISFFFSNKVQFETDMNHMNYLSEKLAGIQEKMSRDNDAALRAVYLVSEGRTYDEALRNIDNIRPKIDTLTSNKLINHFSSPNLVLVSDSVQKLRIEKWNSFWTAENKMILKKALNSAGQKFSFKANAFDSFFDVFDKKYSTIKIEDNYELKNTILKEFLTESAGKIYFTSVLKLDEKNKNQVLKNLAGIEPVVAFDKQSLTNAFVEDIKFDFDLLVKLSLLLVTVVLILSFGRFELGLIVSVPMFLSWLLTLGFMGVFGIKFNIFNIIISTFIFGLGTDYSVIMMRGLQQKFKYGTDELSSYKSSVFVSASTTIIGVGVLIFAKHPALNSIALISVIGMVSVVLVSWSFQPILFKWLIMSRKGKRTYPITLINLFATIWTDTLYLIGCIIGFVTGHLVFTLIPPTKKIKSFKYTYHFMMMVLCGTVIYANFHIRKRLLKSKNRDFSKPAVIICNHQSHVDIPLMIRMNPKLILLTNDWVWNSPFFGSVVKFADFYPVSLGFENSIERLKDRVREGYSIVVFPEGTRSRTGEISRFHKGAFFIAEQLNLDILPVLLHGTGNAITKGEILVKKSAVSVKFLDRITQQDKSFGENYQERTKKIGTFFRQKYKEFAIENETPKFFRDMVTKNYIYKGPILEWYVRSKLSVENNYELLHNLLPKSGLIVDLGCGYGYVDYMMAFLSKARTIIAVDFDESKILLAANCHIQPENLSFINSDIVDYDLPPACAYILGDVLHYLSSENQKALLEKCALNLNDDGVIIIRDVNQDLKYRSYGTKITELISTTFSFNKANFSDLKFDIKENMQEITEKYNLDMEITDNSTYTSNVYYLLKKRKA